MKRLLSLLLIISFAFTLFTFFPQSAFASGDYSALGGTVVSDEELHEGVSRTHIVTGSDSAYRAYSFNLLTVDMHNAGVYIDSAGAGNYANNAATVDKILKKFDDANPDRTALAAVNADLWMMVPHTRTYAPYNYGGTVLNDVVMKKSVSLPRGFVVYDGELITSQYMITETPYQGEFYSFGVTHDGRAVMGCPIIDIMLDGEVSADGLNRLPANNSLVVYTDRGCQNNYALDDAYEIMLDVGDYKITSESTVTGKVEAIFGPDNTENPTMSDGKIILTARGSAVEKISGYKIGDTVDISFSVYEKYGRDSDDWKQLESAVGGHAPFVIDGVKREIALESGYPSTIVGIKNDGSVLLATIDTGIDGKRGGISGDRYWRLADDLDLNCAMLLDGGGSATMAVNYDGEYKIVNNPTDSSGPRPVINALVVSFVEKQPNRADTLLSFPYEKTDLTEVYFDTKEGRALIGNQSESISKFVADGIEFSAKDLVNGSPSFTLSFGLPNTEHYNPASSLAEKQYPSVNADVYKYILLEMKSDAYLKSNLQINYLSAGDIYSPSPSSFKFNFIENNGEWNTYILDMSDVDAWSGQVHNLRFTYLVTAEANGTIVREGDSVVVRSVKLAKSATEASAISADNRKADAFTDIIPGAWYYPAARYNIVHGNIAGTTATTFAPTVTLTRAMFVTMLGKLDGIDTGRYTKKVFPDVNPTDWMGPFVAWANENGIVKGYGSGAFGPSDPITREQMAVIIAKYAEYLGYDTFAPTSYLDRYSDKGKISSWALESLAYCNSIGIINGKSAAIIAPLDNTTRVEASQMIYSLSIAIKLGAM